MSGGFGKNGKIPWNIPEDLKHFKEITDGNICIMGRRTYEDMHDMIKVRQKKKKKLKHILAGRKSIVLTQQKDYQAEGAEVFHSLMEACQNFSETDNREIFIIGGERLFIESLPSVYTIHMTIVKNQKGFDCDRFFPLDYLMKKFKIVDAHQTDKCYYIQYKRVRH